MTWAHVGTAAYIYVIHDGDLVKVGSSIDPQVRWKRQIRRGTLVHVSPPHANGRKVERVAHRLLKSEGLCVVDEWFSTTPDLARSAIERAARIVDGDEQTIPGVPVNALCVVSGYVDAEVGARFKAWLSSQGPNMTSGMALEIALSALMDQQFTRPHLSEVPEGKAETAA